MQPQKSDKRAPIAITVGDPAGVGCEIILKWANENIKLCPLATVIAHKELLEKLPDTIGKVQVGDSDFSPIAGNPTPEGSKIASQSLEEAASGCLEGRYAAVVTAPISKLEMSRIGFNFPGQTEFFATRWGGTPVMAFAGEKLLLSLVTWHVPIAKVPELINAQKITDAVNCAAELARKARNVENPKIAVCALNPHAGEGGILGCEEIEIINPCLNELRKKHPNLSEALPPDTVFERALRGEFDCIVSMYHDQALAPLKALEFDKAVNVSMNLPHLRVSPDHGTGFSIAGKEIASASSFSCAFNLALKLISNQ